MGRSPRTVHCGNVFSACCLALALLGGCSAGVKATPTPAGAGGNDGGAVDVAPKVDSAAAGDRRARRSTSASRRRPMAPACLSRARRPAANIAGRSATAATARRTAAACPGAGQICTDHICVEGPTCVRGTCNARGRRPLLRPDRHRLRRLDRLRRLPGGPDLQFRRRLRAGELHARAAATSPAAAAKYCGRIGDGCGRTIDCTCAAPLTCAGTGIPNVCGDPNCVPITLQPDGRRSVLRADRQRLRQGARLSGHLHRRGGLPGEPRLSAVAAAPPAAASSARSCGTPARRRRRRR